MAESEELKVDPKQAETHEGQLAAERMASGEEKLQQVNVEADYEASKEYSVSDVDKSGTGEAAAAAATAPKQKMPEPTEMKSSPDTTGNPDDYREMAKDVNPRVNA
ncbi:MAG TPA: hypothetical protein V6D14_28390 [Coleofasciculaceae cyanobacterium]|jgi:hypothetical protein